MEHWLCWVQVVVKFHQSELHCVQYTYLQHKVITKKEATRIAITI